MWLKFALFSTLLTPFLHILVLIVNGQNPISTPISFLSRFQLSSVHTLALVLFGLAHVALAAALGGLDRGRLWPIARALLVASGLGLVYVSYYFVTSSEVVLRAPSANDPLWIVSSLTGIAMGALQPGLARMSRGLGLFSAMCLGIWLLLMPLLLIVDASWLGAYERIVGSIYIIWMLGVTLGLTNLSTRRGQSGALPG